MNKINEDVYIFSFVALVFALATGVFVWIVREVVKLSSSIQPATSISTILSNPVFVATTLLAFIVFFVILNDYVGLRRTQENGLR